MAAAEVAASDGAGSGRSPESRQNGWRPEEVGRFLGDGRRTGDAEAAAPQGPPISPRRGKVHHAAEVEAILASLWVPAAAFAAVEAGCYATLRRSFFQVLTDGAFVQWPRYEAVVEAHAWGGVALWSLGAAQILLDRTRRDPGLLWVHRRAGEVMLVLFYSVVFPTGVYLGFAQRIDYLAPMVGAVLMDTALCTAYFLWRGWRCAQLRPRGARSLSLHGRLMRCGMAMSMSIIPQRALQLFLTAELGTHHQANFTASILITAVLFVVFQHFWDGPRGAIWLRYIGGPEDAEEAYGSALPGRAERFAWRVRWVVYCAVFYLARRQLL